MVEQIYHATGMAYKLRSQWDRDEGLGQNHKAVKFLGQDYELLKSQSLQSGRLFEDNLFPCSASSLGFNELGPRSSKTSGVRWMRPPVRNGGRTNSLAEALASWIRNVRSTTGHRSITQGWKR